MPPGYRLLIINILNEKYLVSFIKFPKFNAIQQYINVINSGCAQIIYFHSCKIIVIVFLNNNERKHCGSVHTVMVIVKHYFWRIPNTSLNSSMSTNNFVKCEKSIKYIIGFVISKCVHKNFSTINIFINLFTNCGPCAISTITIRKRIKPKSKQYANNDRELYPTHVTNGCLENSFRTFN